MEGLGENPKGRDLETGGVTEMGEREERQEEIKKGGNPAGEREERLEATNHRQGFDEDLEGVFCLFPPQSLGPAKSPFLPPPSPVPSC